MTCSHADTKWVENFRLRGRSDSKSLVSLWPQGTVLKSSKIVVANKIDRVVDIQVGIFWISFALENKENINGDKKE